ncbi:hypothetical protein L0668_17140 [Paraglaciecola aquimarina]|uniref:Extradiol ring-cleavage dioxygenase LigAB LigA subunit domain-containing protein n=1 Tax=Paraglaciecola algarum TaxID=3050085 RepID=A0ABS9DBV7_9ALTE|nr:hypothetical protein [Paraglaciecola sp. G1-23]MCF2949847.1 hypothetical protein [Paraglaciecola sp. G1-23]
MSKTLVNFIEELDTNAKLLETYKANPVGTAKDYGLSEEDVKIIEDKNWDELSKRFEDLGKAPRNIRS